MALPDFASFIHPALQRFGEGAEHRLREVHDKVAEVLKLSEEDRAVLLPNGRTPVYEVRTAWAVTYLFQAGALERTRRGVYRITPRGKELLRTSSGRITPGDLMQFEEFRHFINRREEAAQQLGEDGVGMDTPRVSPVPPVERLESAYGEIREVLLTEVLEKLKQVSPRAFERIVVDLLLAMGYGGSAEAAGEAVGRPGDEGIDGVIKEDKLGLDVVYVQAKRWEQSVGRPQVQAFAGALEGKRARKGVFITTSSFTPDARQYVQQIEKKIVLIDGRQLAELMIDHDVGVAVTQTYKLKRVDSDYFEED